MTYLLGVTGLSSFFGRMLIPLLCSGSIGSTWPWPSQLLLPMLPTRNQGLLRVITCYYPLLSLYEAKKTNPLHLRYCRGVSTADNQCSPVYRIYSHGSNPKVSVTSPVWSNWNQIWHITGGELRGHADELGWCHEINDDKEVGICTSFLWFDCKECCHFFIHRQLGSM